MAEQIAQAMWLIGCAIIGIAIITAIPEKREPWK